MATKKELVEQLVLVLRPPKVARDTVRKAAQNRSKDYIRRKIKFFKNQAKNPIFQN